MQLVIDVDDRAPRELLHQMVGRLNGQRTLMQVLARGLEEYERQQFASRGSGTWPADDPDTIALKGGSRVLVDSGGLMRQLTRARVVGDTAVVDEGDKDYARYLRDGKRGMPRRDPAPKPTRRHVERWAEQLVGYIVTGQAR